MKALITGGAGFIGSHLAEALLTRGDKVYVLDDLSTGTIENIQHLRDEPGFSYTIDTVMNECLVANLIDWCDVVFHLAAVVGVRLVIDEPVRTIETNLRGTEIVLRHAAEKGRKVLLASTSEVYGKAGRFPFGEGDDLVLGATTLARWSYACSKAVDEFLALAYWREKALPVVIARFFNTVGPRQTGCYGMVIPSFVEQALTGGAITVYGNGQQTRCFCYVSDVVDAVLRLADHPDAVGGVFNVGSDCEITMLDLAHRVKAKTGSASEIVLVSYEQAYGKGFEDMRRRVPNTTKIYTLTGWEPRTSLDEIIDRVIAYQKGLP